MTTVRTWTFVTGKFDRDAWWTTVKCMRSDTRVRLAKHGRAPAGRMYDLLCVCSALSPTPAVRTGLIASVKLTWSMLPGRPVNVTAGLKQISWEKNVLGCPHFWSEIHVFAYFQLKFIVCFYCVCYLLLLMFLVLFLFCFGFLCWGGCLFVHKQSHLEVDWSQFPQDRYIL